MNPSCTFRLDNLLNQYENFIVGKTTTDSLSKDKEALEMRLANVIAVCAKGFKKLQAHSLLEFKASVSVLDSENRIVKIIAYLEPVLRLVGTMPIEVQSLVQVFGDISCLPSLPVSRRLSLGSNVIDRILQENIQDPQPEYSKLLHFTQILAVYWDEPFVKNSQGALYDKLISLREKAASSLEASAKKFCEISITIIKKMEKNIIPNDVKELEGYHGTAIEKGISILHEMLKIKGTIDIPFINPVIEYCKDHLKPLHYIIRNSTSIPSQKDDTQGINYFTITITYFDNAQNVINTRVTRSEKDGVVSWFLCLPSELSKDKEQEGKKSLHEIMRSTFPGFQPVAAPTPLYVSNYLSSKISRINY